MIQRDVQLKTIFDCQKKNSSRTGKKKVRGYLGIIKTLVHKRKCHIVLTNEHHTSMDRRMGAYPSIYPQHGDQSSINQHINMGK